MENTRQRLLARRRRTRVQLDRIRYASLGWAGIGILITGLFVFEGSLLASLFGVAWIAFGVAVHQLAGVVRAVDGRVLSVEARLPDAAAPTVEL